MKTIKIFALPSHQEKDKTHGVDFVRVIQPIQHLNGYTDGEVAFKTEIFNIHEKTDWLYVAKNFDIIFLNYINTPWGFAAMGAMARKFGAKLVLDLDDALWHVRSDNPAYNVYHKGSEALLNFNAICNEVDYMSTTSSYLKHVIMNNTNKRSDQVQVLPNYIDLDFYKHRSVFKDTGQIRLTHFGSTTHFIDLDDFQFVQGVDRIMKEYPNVVFTTVGAFIPKFRDKWGARYENPFGHQDIYHWVQDKDRFPKYMSETDILVVPLDDDIYNRCKSPIKWLEASSAKIPGVWQDIRQYQEVIDGTNGLLARKSTDWYKAIKTLIDDKELRRNMGEKAHDDVKKNWTIQSHVKEYANFFKMVLDNSEKQD